MADQMAMDTAAIVTIVCFGISLLWPVLAVKRTDQEDRDD